MADIRTEHVTKAYGRLVAVDDVSLSVKSGELVVLLGPSGSGKTTLLKCIAGLEVPDQGDVFIDGERVNDLPPRERDISMVFQSYALFPLMTVSQNIGFPLKVRGESDDAIERRVKEVGELLGISKSMESSPKGLSGGEQQRVAIGRAIVRPTKALFMDEPLSSLDAPLRAQLRADLKSLQRELGLTVVYVTHDQVEAMALADKMGVINSGRMLQFGSPREVYDRPSSSFVARFVGTPGANLIEVAFDSTGDSPALRGPGVTFAVPDQLASQLRGKEGLALTLAVRPESVILSPTRTPSSFGASVELVEDLGATKILDVKAGQTLLRVLVPLDFKASPGDVLWGSIDFGRAGLFEADGDTPIWTP